MKIALALIVKGTDAEAKLLDQCLDNVSPYVDGIFVTSTYKDVPNNKINAVAAKYGANVSTFKWVNDFSVARNFNFSKVTKEYDYILWCDADDVFRGLENLRTVMEANKDVDVFAFNYLYAFDDYKNPIVVHKKSQVIRNDGCVSWMNRIHEDFKENRSINVKFVENIERMHMATNEHNQESAKRNLEISKLDVKDRGDDPTSHFNLGNSYYQLADFENAKKEYLKFIDMSESEDEKYIIYQRLSSVEHCLDNKESSIQYLKLAIGTFPDLPDAYTELGQRYFDYNRLDDAEYILLLGVAMKPRYHKMIAFNPRDYDYKPMHTLAKVYLNKSRPDYALQWLEGCLKIYPKNTELQGLVEEMKKEVSRLEKVIEVCKKIDSYEGNKEKILFEIKKLSPDLQSHPAICRIRNRYIVKTESTGKDIAYYCGQTLHEWNPEMAKTKGIGGSEEAVINLSKQWVKMGYNVTVYNSCGNEPMKCDGVEYKPFWFYNPHDKYDHMILWRSPRLADADLNVTNMYVDLHDVIQEGEFTEKRLKKIKKIFVKTKAHQALFPNIADDKFAVIPNGQDFNLFANICSCLAPDSMDSKSCHYDDKKKKLVCEKGSVKNCEKCKGKYDVIQKDPYLLVNTSSPERSMDVLPKLFKRVKERVPQARLKWAYGFEIFNNAHKNNKKMMEWKETCEKEMKEAGIENCGRLSQSECAKLYMEGRILAYPSEFYEIDCISLKKAQACGCKPITTDFAAFDESNQYGIKLHSKKNKDNWSKPYQFSFGIDDEKLQDEWVEKTVEELQKPMVEETAMKEWTQKFAWPLIAEQWKNIF